ncbi:MAG: AI-2E family transporter, partial [Clostridia bacterium]|nr:AI-2E family transporter [Deltaproteobacteria bacterium]
MSGDKPNKPIDNGAKAESEPPTRATDPAPTPAAAARGTFLILLVASLVVAGAVFLPVWQPVILGAALAATVVRYYDKLVKHLRGRRALGAAIMTVGVLLFVLLPLAGLVSFLIIQGAEVAKVVSELVNTTHGVTDLIVRLPDGLQEYAQKLAEVVPIDTQELSAKLASGSKWAAATVGSVLSAASGLVFHLALTLIAFYFFLIDGPDMVRWIAGVLPLKERQTYEVLHDFREMARVVIGSNVIVGGLQAIAAVIGYLVAPIPHPYFFALLTFIASFIPSVGTALISVPLVLYLFILGRWVWAIGLFAWTVLLVGGIDNILRPWLLRGAG